MLTIDQIKEWSDNNVSKEMLIDIQYYHGLNQEMMNEFVMNAINGRSPQPPLDKTLNIHIVFDREEEWFQYYFILASNGSPIAVKKLNRLSKLAYIL